MGVDGGKIIGGRVVVGVIGNVVGCFVGTFVGCLSVVGSGVKSLAVNDGAALVKVGGAEGIDEG